MDNYTRSIAEKLYSKNTTTPTGRSKKREEMLQRRRFKALPLHKKAEVIKERYGLTHGGTKQNKKKRKKRG